MKYENIKDITKKYPRGTPSFFCILVCIFSAIRNGNADLRLMLNDLIFILLLFFGFLVCFLIFLSLFKTYLKLTGKNQQRQTAIAQTIFYFLFWGWILVETATYPSRHINHINKGVKDIMDFSIFYIILGAGLVVWQIWLNFRKTHQNRLETAE